ncbi:Plasmodium exported protein, unknown function [Plasmodium relictum]|uniref:Fam-h protein n=1 Tax=Plasmodium relictum TaxID=85471 RepID=A0A1J1GNF6_PLARL|nr:Plasmodium exported protein, unknown function [Plasmodium relictum]CRG84082.1 Plasmodium exported protein, unknown function [Plasmodium relictum]
MMNKRNNIISNIKKYPRCNNYVNKSFIVEYISTLKMYNKREKDIILNSFIKLFIFVLFILMLQCSCNLDSGKSLKKSNVENMPHLGNERSLAESEDTVKANEQSDMNVTHKLPCNNQGIEIKVSSQSEMGQRNNGERDCSVIENLGEGNSAEQGIGREKIDKNEERNIKERILNIAKGNFQLIILFIISLLSFISSIICMSSYNKENTNLNNTSVLLVAISIIFTVFLLMYERIQDKNEQYYK